MMKALLTACALAFAALPAVAAPDQLFQSVRAELNAMGLKDVSIQGLSSHELSTIKHILHSNSTPSAMRAKIMAIVDPERHSIRGLFK